MGARQDDRFEDHPPKARNRTRVGSGSGLARALRPQPGRIPIRIHHW
jgi:hypothetical protein